MSPVAPRIRRKRTKILRDSSRVITRLHVPDRSRIPGIIERIAGMSEDSAGEEMERILHEFSHRHMDFRGVLERNYGEVAEFIPEGTQVSQTKRALIGAYFTMEYAIESAALFNPSIVPHPDQTGMPEGSLRFIMSLRATGEGHISSIVFREGTLDRDINIVFRAPGELVETPEMHLDPLYDRHLFQLKLVEMDAFNETTDRVLVDFPEQFTYSELNARIGRLISDPTVQIDSKAIAVIYWLARSNYEVKFRSERELSERVIFPNSENERSGVEDARFVQFFDDDGTVTYYATYTAYNRVDILPQLIETKDFETFKVSTLNGRAVQNKGMALFPRKVNGLYTMLSRQDGVNNQIMFSDNVRFWQESRVIQEPLFPWEFIQVGNCGSPLEINEGWLVLTHGVGPMRRYCIGAVLLDRDDPSKVIARLREPLLAPLEAEREGYVPNVVYSCGAIIHNNELVIPYAMSDISSAVATVSMRELVDCLLAAGTQQ